MNREQRRIVVAMGSSEDSQGFFVPQARRGEQVELAEDLGQALSTCLEKACDRLYISLFSVDARQLTSLAFFRRLRPGQHIVLVVDPALKPLIDDLGLADECLTFEN